VSRVTNWIAHHGALAVFVLMAIDALLPVGGELIMVYAGALGSGAVAGHELTVLGAHPAPGLEGVAILTLAGTLGYLAGAIAGWAIGARGGRPLIERHGRWLHITPDRLRRAERWFDRFGPLAVFLGRVTPVVRSFISVPAGALGSPLSLYVPLSFAGSLLWCAAFAAAGWALGASYEQLHHAFRYVDYAVVAAILVGAGVLARKLAARKR
jgi:membrane protein DedA with SNARE-associated domain